MKKIFGPLLQVVSALALLYAVYGLGLLLIIQIRHARIAALQTLPNAPYYYGAAILGGFAFWASQRLPQTKPQAEM